MANGEYITTFQGIDFALGAHIASCYTGLASDGGKDFKRFLTRPTNEKIFYAQNEDIQTALRKITARVNDPIAGGTGPDLPCIIYYRDNTIAADSNSYPRIIEATRFDEVETKYAKDKAMTLTLLPVSLTYSMLFLSWDKDTLDRLAVAWWGWLVPLKRKNSRFTVKYKVNDEELDVPANIFTPREILTSSESVSIENMRLWGSKTSIQVDTQAIYGYKVEIADYIKFVGVFDIMYPSKKEG